MIAVAVGWNRVWSVRRLMLFGREANTNGSACWTWLLIAPSGEGAPGIEVGLTPLSEPSAVPPPTLFRLPELTVSVFW